MMLRCKINLHFFIVQMLKITLKSNAINQNLTHQIGSSKQCYQQDNQGNTTTLERGDNCCHTEVETDKTCWRHFYWLIASAMIWNTQTMTSCKTIFPEYIIRKYQCALRTRISTTYQIITISQILEKTRKFQIDKQVLHSSILIGHTTANHSQR